MSTFFPKSLEHFHNEIAIKFQLYNSLFLSLPFSKIEKTGLLLSVLQNYCEEGYAQGQNAEEIINSFVQNQTNFDSEQKTLDLLFRFIQYIERQIVLFDALEDAAYDRINDISGPGTLKHLQNKLNDHQYTASEKKTLENFSVRLVMTAHPTQFYPGSVLGIIGDLSKALQHNQTDQINILLQQLGKTPFLNKKKPSPYEEAVSLIWFLENVFYHTIGSIANEFKSTLPFMDPAEHPIVKMGFWPGGDRDGNPFVRADTTYKVANSLNIAILKCYYRDVRKLKRRLTFKNIDTIIAKLESDLYEQAFLRTINTIRTMNDIIGPLKMIREILFTENNGLFIENVDELIDKVHCFGMHFAFIDVRQENEVHTSLLSAIMENNGFSNASYDEMSEIQKINFILDQKLDATPDQFEDEIFSDTLLTMQTIRKIQENFGQEACHRYIISQCTSALNVIEVLALFKISGWDVIEVNMDIVPLFETIDDLVNAPMVMKSLYELPIYKSHLKRRKNRQTIMLGFSDGTKDGGYLMANWMIYKAKEELSKMSKEYGIDVMFFDGRGGPPARGGGKTHKFYASMNKEISSKEIQLTIQGQTISTNFGIMESARFNIEQLINAGVTNNIFQDEANNFTKEEESLILSMSEISLKTYLALKNDSNFVDYMSEVSPLKYFGMANIGSRPAKRGKVEKLTIKDLRAIPFVASWNMIKQNVPGFYGLGTAINSIIEKGQFEQLKAIYKNSLFFRTLMDNSEMSLIKTFMPLTSEISNHPVFGDIWQRINAEYKLTSANLLLLGDHTTLMEEYPVDKLSIQMREKIMIPLATIQQYGLSKLREMNQSGEEELDNSYQKMIIRCAFGIINGGRNSA